MAAVANLRPVKDDAPVQPVRKGSASLGHIKEKRADGREPWDPAPVETIKKRRIAWPGGKISSNKDEALLMYFSKKLARGEALTDAQKTAFAHATKGTRFEGLSEKDAMALAAAEAKKPGTVSQPKYYGNIRGIAQPATYGVGAPKK